MNLSDQQSPRPMDPDDDGRIAVLQRFKLGDIQYLEPVDLLIISSLVGHGHTWGHWLTPKSISPGRLSKPERNIDFARRIRDFLANDLPTIAISDQLIDEGVLLLTRFALLVRLIPTSRRTNGRPKRLKPSSIAALLYCDWARLVARAILRKAANHTTAGLLESLSKEDMVEFQSSKKIKVELARVRELVAQGAWSDSPPHGEIWKITDPSQKPADLQIPKSQQPYLPFPDDWLVEIGPRALWVVQEMGPHLLDLLTNVVQEIKSIEWMTSASSRSIQNGQLVQACLRRRPWLDRAGKPLTPPFSLITCHGRRGADKFEWPPRLIQHVVTLAVTLQAAHLFIALLATAGRVGEVTALKRDCVAIARDGLNYLNGHTYKLSDGLLGDARTWPAPEILCQAIGQQARLAAAFDWLPKSSSTSVPKTPRFADALWVSIGTSGSVGENCEININRTLFHLARRLGVDSKPGGSNFHAHRCRKTIGRLAGIALFNSPLVLKRLFGHKSIEMTLHYILCDPGVREEAENVLRELRIMHCADALDEIQQSLREGIPLPDNGGPGAARLVTSVRSAELNLNEVGRLWTDGTAYDLACLLTMQGQSWRLVKENVICSKAPSEGGLCMRQRSTGEPNTADCQPECGNRIVLASRRRECERLVESYLDLARQARDDGQLLVLASILCSMQEEIADHSELQSKYQGDPEVRSMLAMIAEPHEMVLAQ